MTVVKSLKNLLKYLLNKGSESLKPVSKNGKKKKSLINKLTTRSQSKAKTDTPLYHLRRGIEAKLPEHIFLEDWGNYYQSILRTGLNDLQSGQSVEEIERSYQKRFNIQ